MGPIPPNIGLGGGGFVTRIGVFQKIKTSMQKTLAKSTTVRTNFDCYYLSTIFEENARISQLYCIMQGTCPKNQCYDCFAPIDLA